VDRLDRRLGGLTAGREHEFRGDPVTVQVHLPTVLRLHAGGAKTVPARGSTVGEVLVTLVEEYPGLKGQVVNDDGTLHKFVNVYLNDDDIRYLSALDTPVEDTDEISILPAVAGGAGGDLVPGLP
jgi:molybdopterin converting factor small subunit